MIWQHHKRRQIFVLTAKCVTDPAPGTWKSGGLKTCRLKIRRRTMNARFANHIVNKRHIVNARTEFANNRTELFSTFAIGLKFPGRLHPWPQTILKRLHFFAKVGGLTMMLDQCGFEIKHVQRTRRPSHKKLNDTLRFRRVMNDLTHRFFACERLPLHHGAQSKTSKSPCGLL